MCLGAIYWARPKRVIYANTKKDAAAINFDDQIIYDEIDKPDKERTITFVHHPYQKAIDIFKEWQKMGNKIEY
jgi:tRNA(Arg) A34 adenosine deaminase TadA